MEDYEQEQENSNFLMQTPIPNATAALVLGIISIALFLCCNGIVSIILGIIGLVLGLKATKRYINNPEDFTEVSYKNANAGKICSIIGLIIGVFWLARSIVTLINNWDLYLELFQQLKNGSFDPTNFMK
jgi:hypothetical protein